jgi:hypothetical protein
MPARKVSRKGKLDQDLPFREPKTFAIFPKRFGGWEFRACHEVFSGSPGPPLKQTSNPPFHRQVHAG